MEMTHAKSALLCAILWTFAASACAQGIQMPAQADIVASQAAYAKVQLHALAAIYGADPSGLASKEAFEKGNAPALRGWSSPVQGWPARGPSLGESVQPLMAMALAGKMGCKQIQGDCQDRAMRQAGDISKKVLSAKNPGAEFSAQVSLLD